MKLLKLTMQAFGPFANKVEIHFEDNNINHGLLLITGDTGAGKTTIFDAICFALYGKTSGETREVNSLRSDYAKDDIETYVNLEFEYKNKIYKVKRNPEYLRKSKRGEGYTKQVSSAEFEINGRMETKTNLVTKEIETLLGLDYKQFCQIAMLSQGEFTKFLLATADEKTTIFRKIFNTEIFSDISSKLKDNLTIIEQEYKQTKLNLDNEKTKLYEFINNYQEYLNSDLIHIIEDKLNIMKLELSELLTLKDELNESNRLKLSKLSKIKEINKKLDDLKENKNSLDKLINNYPNILKDKINLNYNIKVVPQIKELINYQNKIKNDLVSSRNKKNNIYSELDIYNKKYIINTDKYKIIENYPNELNKLNNNLTKLKEELTNLVKYKNLLTDKEKLINILKDKIKIYQEDYNKYENMKKVFYLNEAYNLSLELIDDKPCMVCGSLNHPKKAENIKCEWTKEDIQNCESKVLKSLEDRKNIEARIDTINEEINKYNDCDNINIDINKLNNKIKTTEEEINHLTNNYNITKKEENELRLLLEKLKKENEILDDVINNLSNEISDNEEKLKKLYNEENTSYEEYINSLLEKDQLVKLEKKIKEYDNNYQKYTTIIELLEKETENKQYQDITIYEEELHQGIVKYNQLDSDYTNKFVKVDKLSNILESIIKYNHQIDKIQSKYQVAKILSDTANGRLTGKQKNNFENYVQSYYLKHVLKEANIRLNKITEGRFSLQKKEVSTNLNEKLGIEFSIFDAYTGKVRDVTSLSGGEKFKTALSLALGLSDVISMFAGGIKINALFVDEGFGSLDQESLNQAINTLSDLTCDDKLVAIISHVSELISRIDNKIIVKKGNNGSKLVVESNN